MRVSLFAAMLAAAGIPLYIHLPLFAAGSLGLSLGTVGTLLLAIRVIDLVQDPAIGWMIDRWPRAQAGFAMVAAGGLAIGFPLLFSLSPGPWAVTQMVAVLILLFSAYSLGMILLYGRSATLAERPTPEALLSLAAFREGGMLAGVILAAALPTMLGGYPAFGLTLGALAVLTAVLTLPLWRRPAITGARLSMAALRQSGGLGLLFLALINSLPVAVTSTLFLFFVEDRLQLPGLAGPFLILFFLSAGLSVPLWTALSRRIQPRRALLIAMPLAIIGFIGAATLGPGDALAFALVCVASGAALGADMVILPAMFSVALTRSGLQASTAFGIWSIAGKLGLALAAFLILPILERSGFTPGGDNAPEALRMLTLCYAVLPCGLKLCAFLLLLWFDRRQGP